MPKKFFVCIKCYAKQFFFILLPCVCKKSNSQRFIRLGGIAQLARVLDWQSRGQGFDSPYLHQENQPLTAFIEVGGFLFDHSFDHSGVSLTLSQTILFTYTSY